MKTVSLYCRRNSDIAFEHNEGEVTYDILLRYCIFGTKIDGYVKWMVSSNLDLKEVW